MNDANWHGLDDELDRWADADAPATLWLRDDDAVEATPVLDKLLAMTESRDVPLAVAVIPALAQPSLAESLTRSNRVSVLQHGFTHANHAPPGAKKTEFAGQRLQGAMTGELVQGRAMLFAMFGDVAEPVLVPPWNRIADCLPPLITACGLRGLSRFKPRVAKEAAPGVIEANTHIDLMDWRNSRVGKPLFVIVDEIIRHLTARRTGAADRHEATGLLTHHLVMDAPAWLALDEVLDRLAKDPRVAWRGAPQIFETVQ